MADERKIKLATQVYKTVCKTLDERNWKYKKSEDELTVTFIVSGDDIPIQVVIAVDAERQLIRLYSPLPFNMKEEKRVEGAIAVCIASHGLHDGSFDYDLSDGQISFRIAASFIKSTVGAELIEYLIDYTCSIVDKYNDRFMAINSDLISIYDFNSLENEE